MIHWGWRILATQIVVMLVYTCASLAWSYLSTRRPEWVPKTQPSSMNCGKPHRFIYYSATGPHNRCINRTKHLHPHAAVDVFTPHTAELFMKTNCPAAHPAYQKVKPFAYKADLFRYCALYTIGGIYLDDDLYLTAPWNVPTRGQVLLIQDKVLWNSMGRLIYRDAVWNAMMAACKQSEIFACALQKATKRIIHETNVHYLALTGPALLGECIHASADASFVGYLAKTSTSPLSVYFWNHTALAVHVKVPRDTSVPHYGKFKSFERFNH